MLRRLEQGCTDPQARCNFKGTSGAPVGHRDSEAWALIQHRLPIDMV